MNDFSTAAVKTTAIAAVKKDKTVGTKKVTAIAPAVNAGLYPQRPEYIEG